MSELFQLEPIEIEFKKLIPRHIDAIYKDFNNKDLSQEEIRALDSMGNFQCCVVGSVRARLGLSREYDNKYDESLPYCQDCYDLAMEIFNNTRNEYNDKGTARWDREKYLDNLESLKKHLEKDHGVKVKAK